MEVVRREGGGKGGRERGDYRGDREERKKREEERFPYRTRCARTRTRVYVQASAAAEVAPISTRYTRQAQLTPRLARYHRVEVCVLVSYRN